MCGLPVPKRGRLTCSKRCQSERAKRQRPELANRCVVCGDPAPGRLTGRKRPAWKPRATCSPECAAIARGRRNSVLMLTMDERERMAQDVMDEQEIGPRWSYRLAERWGCSLRSVATRVALLREGEMLPPGR